MSFMKNLLPTTLPPQLTQYQEVTTLVIQSVRQAENLLIAIDLITHPWDDIFLRASLREMSRSLWEEVMLMWSYTHQLTGTINDIHRGTATTIQFNPVKYMTTVQNIVYNTQSLQESCMSFINVSHQLRYMSLMNMNILTREISRLGEYITNWQTLMRTLSASHSTYLQSVSQVIQQQHADEVRIMNNIHETEQVHSRKYDVTVDHLFSGKPSHQTASVSTESTHRELKPQHVVYESPREYQTKQTSGIDKKPYLETSVIENENGTERKDQIISMVRNRGVVSINDISEHFPTLSRKTLQRDLSELIETGKILRTGDKRWATYRV